MIGSLCDVAGFIHIYSRGVLHVQYFAVSLALGNKTRGIIYFAVSLALGNKRRGIIYYKWYRLNRVLVHLQNWLQKQVIAWTII